jgi:hypothetical protein
MDPQPGPKGGDFKKKRRNMPRIDKDGAKGRTRLLYLYADLGLKGGGIESFWKGGRGRFGVRNRV